MIGLQVREKRGIRLFPESEYTDSVSLTVTRHFGARGMSSVRYGIRLGDLEENRFLCFPIKHSTHTPHPHSLGPKPPNFTGPVHVASVE